MQKHPHPHPNLEPVGGTGRVRRKARIPSIQEGVAVPSLTGIVLEYGRLPDPFSRERAILAQLRDLLGHARDIQTHREAAGALLDPLDLQLQDFKDKAPVLKGADERAAEEDRRAPDRS